MKSIRTAHPYVTRKGRSHVHTILKSGSLTQGKAVQQFESKLGELLDLPAGVQVVTVSNGTQALVLALSALGIGHGDQVIVPAFSFAATAHAVSMVGACPVFCDVDRETFHMDPKLIEPLVTPHTKAIIVAHLFGFLADVPAILKVASRHNLLVIEDAAQAAGANRADYKVGVGTSAACYSFYATKNIFAGEGGAVVSSDASLADRIRIIRNQGMRGRYEFEFPGTNARMTDIQAAIGLDSLRQFKRNQEKRSKLADLYSISLEGGPWKLPSKMQNRGPRGWHQYCILLDESLDRSRLVEECQDAGVPLSVYYPEALSALSYYKEGSNHCPNAEYIASRIVALPMHPRLTWKQAKHVVKILKRVV